MRTLLTPICIGLLLFIADPALAQNAGLSELQRQVADTERAFAKTMADRDHKAFTTFLSDETVFFITTPPLRGKTQVAN